MVCGDPNMPAFVYNNDTMDYDITAIGILERMLIDTMRGCNKMSILSWNGDQTEDYFVGWRLEFDGEQNDTLVFININQYEYQANLMDDTIMNCTKGIDDTMIIKSIYANALDILVKSHSTMNDLNIVTNNISDNMFVIPQWSINAIKCNS